MLTKNQMLEMLLLQDKMNSTVNPEWKRAGYDFTLAIMMEASECVDLIGWKWWKKQERDMAQAHLELIDIFHFMLSELIIRRTLNADVPYEVIAESYVNALETGAPYTFAPSGLPVDTERQADISLLQCVRAIAAEASVGMLPNQSLFNLTLQKADLPWDALYKGYVGKNVLNIFRQKNGYKSGGYIKDWSAVRLTNTEAPDRKLEDNDHLHDILCNPDANSLTAEHIENALFERYSSVVLAAMTA